MTDVWHSSQRGVRGARQGQARRLLVIGLGLLVTGAAAPVAEPGSPYFYSTAEPPADYPGIQPASLRIAADPSVRPARAAALDEVPDLAEPVPMPSTTPVSNTGGAVTRLATASSDSPGPDRGKLDLERRTEDQAPGGELDTPARVIEDPIVRARRMMASCKATYQQVNDYSCVFYKRERVDGELLPYQVMQMKSRTSPLSVYFRFMQPHNGREAIWVHGRNQGKVVVHDIGINKLIAGTLLLDPRSRRAMTENRHPISDAGIGHLIETVSNRWAVEMDPSETQVKITPGVKVGERLCTLIESTHPRKSPSYMYRTAKVFVDQELNLPIRFEAYDWPQRSGQAPPLVEEYTYSNLRLNVGLSESEFDPSNPSYSFGRF